jgi:hypothetical protein
VVRELLTGAPDTTACRRLGMSPRTFGRRVSELLEFLSVSTRFQAGVVLARRQVEASAWSRHRQPKLRADDRMDAGWARQQPAEPVPWLNTEPPHGRRRSRG